MTEPKQFVRYLALHLYGPETLKKSTISGKPSNRSKKRGTIDGDKAGSEEGSKEGIELPETLDPEKLEAVRGDEYECSDTLIFIFDFLTRPEACGSLRVSL
ncbi:hypothetical protein QAD02_003118 [Eretmocerus hayati]|uniref:Uncharacterized protein n=1 Tax=Eretmocerus hayati TaxID=131215 RepID=A0ACC2NKR7_9HYME|nr:hypothetical protein QAD02_003118 [Eretmocerus hayati]